MNLKQLILHHPIFSQAEDIQTICAPLQALGITYFCHVHVSNDNVMTALSNYPEFSRHYMQQGYQQFDIHWISLDQPAERMVIWDTLQRRKETLQMHEDFKLFGKGHTFSILSQTPEGKDCFHFATEAGNESMNQRYLQLLEPLNKFISYFRDKVSRSKALQKAYQIPVFLDKEAGSYQTQENAETAGVQTFLEQISHQRHYLHGLDTYLTKAEYQCLYWLGQGKTLDEAGLILGITQRTVRAHVRQIKEKLGCTNLFQLGVLFNRASS